MTPIDWDRPDWGLPPHNVHIADWCADRHTDELADD